MALPKVEGWMIDFRTARTAFASRNNERIDHLIDMCSKGRLFTCHCEQSDFKGVQALKQAFYDDNQCMCVPNDDVLKRCLSISKTPLGKGRLQGNDADLFITATAAAHNFGVISDHTSIIYTTVVDLCQAHGIPVYSSEDYFALL